MKKQSTIKEDGRTLVYYWFTKEPADSTADGDCTCDCSEPATPCDCTRETECRK